MLPVQLKFSLALSCVCLLIQGCIGNSGSDPLRGVFLDSPVSGLKYSTETKEGFTGEDGAFYYQEGESIVFSIGDLFFPEVVAGPTITPLEIAQVEDVENEKTINLLRLLQTIDVDQNPDNGITIPETAHTSVQISRLTFDGSISAEGIISSVIAQTYTSERSLVDSQTAVNHFIDTLSQEAQGEPIDIDNFSQVFLVEQDETFNGDTLSIQNSDYILNLDGSAETGVGTQSHNALRLKSSANDNRFVTSVTSDEQLLYCIGNRPTVVAECGDSARLFAVFQDQDAAEAFDWASVSIFAAEGSEPLVFGAASESDGGESETVETVTDETETETGETDATTPDTDVSDTADNQNPQAEQDAGGDGTQTGDNNDVDTPSTPDDTDSGTGNEPRVVIAQTDCPASVTAPAEFSVRASEPVGCKWTAFDSTPWSWSPAESYTGNTNLVVASEAGDYVGEFEHTCVEQSSGDTITVTASCAVAVAPAIGPQDITDLFFITGQANASGVETVYDETADVPDGRVFAFTDEGWQIADLHQHWEQTLPGNSSQDDTTRQPYNHIGFQLTKKIAEQSDRVVGLVVLTAPGEGISHWDYNSEFYTEIREKATAALNELPNKSQFDAMVWMQGETDWLFEGTADPGFTGVSFDDVDAYTNYYPGKLQQLISNLRSEYWFRFDGKFVCTETKKASLNPHLMALNSDSDAYTACAPAADLPTRTTDPYGNHFSANSLRMLGARIAELYLSLDE